MLLPNHVLAIDFETTGLVPSSDYPNSISLVEFIDGVPTGARFSRRILPDAKAAINLEALQVQGLSLDTGDIDPSDLVDKLAKEVARLFPANAIPAMQAMAELTDWTSQYRLSRVPLVAHMASFDHGFYDQRMNSYLFRPVHRGATLSPVWICTRTLACHVMPASARKDLNSCLAFLGLAGRESAGHDSLEDAGKCGEVYFGFRSMIEGAVR